MFQKLLASLKEILLTEISLKTKESPEDIKRAAKIKDSLRLMAWDLFRNEHGQRGGDNLSLYMQFSEIWKKKFEPLTLKQTLKFIKELDLTEQELMDMRNEYYRR